MYNLRVADLNENPLERCLKNNNVDSTGETLFGRGNDVQHGEEQPECYRVTGLNQNLPRRCTLITEGRGLRRKRSARWMSNTPDTGLNQNP